MDRQIPQPSGKSYVAIAVSEAWLRAQVRTSLTSFYACGEYTDCSSTLSGCRQRTPMLVLVSQELPPSGGYDVVRMLRLEPKLAAIPIVMLAASDDKPTRNAVAKCGADGLVVVPFSRSTLVASVSGTLNRGVERKWQRLPPLQREALSNTLEIFNGLSNVISEGKPVPYQAVSDACKPLVEAVASDDFRGVLKGVRDHDNYSYVHSLSVATYLALFGATLGLAKEEQTLLATGGLLHDIGKMTIPFEVLNKPGRLDEDEMAVMQGHVTASVAYLERCKDVPKGIVTIAEQHHETLDGSGYPRGLHGRELNRLARIATIVDVFSALTDRRVYKPPVDAETALNIMVDEMASKLDVKLVGLFREMLLDASAQLGATALD